MCAACIGVILPERPGPPRIEEDIFLLPVPGSGVGIIIDNIGTIFDPHTGSVFLFPDFFYYTLLALSK